MESVGYVLSPACWLGLQQVWLPASQLPRAALRSVALPPSRPRFPQLTCSVLQLQLLRLQGMQRPPSRLGPGQAGPRRPGPWLFSGAAGPMPVLGEPVRLARNRLA